jgi:pyruvate-ferredoxin/flavodoxin oxidoreductase
MVKAIFDALAQLRPRNHFTIGIVDDVTHTSLDYDDSFRTESDEVTTSLFYGLGADGTVGANKNSIKIIGEETDLYVQGYFVYDSKKSGATTVSHLRTSPRPIRSAYLIKKATFVACHQSSSSSGSTCSSTPLRERSSCSTHPTGRTSCGTTCRASCRSS